MNQANGVLGSQGASEPTWAGISGAIGGCLTVLSCISFWLCLAAFAAGSIARIDEQGHSTPIVPSAVYAFWGLCAFTFLTAILGGTALGIRAFGCKELSTIEGLRVTFVTALLPLRYIIGILQALVFFAGCGLLFYPIVSIAWPIVAFIALSIAQVILLVIFRLIGGPEAIQAVTQPDIDCGI